LVNLDLEEPFWLRDRDTEIVKQEESPAIELLSKLKNIKNCIVVFATDDYREDNRRLKQEATNRNIEVEVTLAFKGLKTAIYRSALKLEKSIETYRSAEKVSESIDSLSLEAFNNISKAFEASLDNDADLLEKELIEKVVWVHPGGGRQPFQRRMKVDPEHMRELGKLGFAATSKKIVDMMADPQANPDDIYGIARFLARRIKSTTHTYRAQWWGEFRKHLKAGENNVVATAAAKAFLEELTSR